MAMPIHLSSETHLLDEVTSLQGWREVRASVLELSHPPQQEEAEMYKLWASPLPLQLACQAH